MNNWIHIATELLKQSLEPLPHEKNELDWKSSLSPKSQRLAQHLSAFSNLSGGGFLVFGVNDEGKVVGVKDSEQKQIVQRLGNIAIIIIVVAYCFISLWFGIRSEKTSENADRSNT